MLLSIDESTSSGWRNGPANGNGPLPLGFPFGGAGGVGAVPGLPATSPGPFVTPFGYKPMGPVSVWCRNGASIEYRGW